MKTGSGIAFPYLSSFKAFLISENLVLAKTLLQSINPNITSNILFTIQDYKS